MTSPHDDRAEMDHHTIAEFLRFYRYTSIYSAVMLTLILIVFVISEFFGG